MAFYGNRSACYLMLGQPRQALEDARTATGLDPGFSKGWSRMARCCVMLGDTVSARQALTKLSALGDDNTGEQKNIEQVEKMVGDSKQACSAGDYRKALWCLDQALQISNYSTTIKTSRAECLAFLGRYAEASETANSVLQIDNLNKVLTEHLVNRLFIPLYIYSLIRKFNTNSIEVRGDIFDS